MSNRKKEPSTGIINYSGYVFGFILLLGSVGSYYLLADSVPIKAPEAIEKEHSTSDIITPIRQQLTDIKNRQIDKAYEQVAAPFRDSMPLDKFREFIAQYGALSNFKSFSFSEPREQEGNAIVTVYLQGDGGAIPVEYSLVLENNRWRILGFIINQGGAEQAANLQEISIVFPTINQLLLLLRKGDTGKIYDELLSSEFKKGTTKVEFDAFIRNFPILSSQLASTVMDGKLLANQAVVQVLVTKGEESIPIDFHLEKEAEEWKVLGFKLLFPPQKQALLKEDDKALILHVINDQLDLFKTGQLDLAYDLYTSSRFKETTTIETFKAFLKEHPLVTSVDGATFLDGGIENEAAVVYVSIGEQPSTLYLTYRLVKEEGKWKILGMNVQAKSEAIPTDVLTTLNPKEFTTKIREALRVLYLGQIQNFYDYETSSEFRKATTLDVFKQFVKDHHFLSEKSQIELLDFSDEDGIVHVKVKVTSEHFDHKVLFDFIKEEEEWKILRIEFDKDPAVKTLAKSEEGESLFMLVGTESNGEGYIKDPTNTISGLDKPVEINLYITAGVENEQIKIVLTHLTTNARTSPVFADLESEGNKMLSFVFNPPPSGWPAGEYKFTVTTTTGKDLEHIITIGP